MRDAESRGQHRSWYLDELVSLSSKKHNYLKLM
jgi:hypothetical protein